MLKLGSLGLASRAPRLPQAGLKTQVKRAFFEGLRQGGALDHNTANFACKARQDHKGLW